MPALISPASCMAWTASMRGASRTRRAWIGDCRGLPALKVQRAPPTPGGTVLCSCWTSCVLTCALRARRRFARSFGTSLSASLASYPIGTPGKKWGREERAAWLAQTSVKRSYFDEVVSKIELLKNQYEVLQYGALSYDRDRYPLFAVKTANFGKTGKPAILVTGGVHGYETSGVQGALLFLQTKAKAYIDAFDIIVAPCVSPWGYETINRWNPDAVDPNRSFVTDSPSEEAAALMELVSSLGVQILGHIDLHETTDTDESEFRPALAARDGEEFKPDSVPDGFYTVGDVDDPQEAFQAAIIQSVRQVTHIAPPDADGNIIGTPVTQEGVINYPTKSLGLCSGFTGATYVTTTEVYPDSPKVSKDDCNAAQLAALTGALDFMKKGLS